MSAEKAETQFSQPVRQTVQMLVVVGLAAAGGWMIYPSVRPVFFANPYLNGAIGFVFVLGVLNCFLQVAQLSASVRWIETFARDHRAAEASRVPRILAPLASLLRARGVNRQISATSATSILESVGTRIEEARDITRYVGNLLIFLGLLGTFYGLATTVPAVVDTIRSLAPKPGENGVDVFTKLMNGLEAQLGGMGTAFGSSLLGLTGSLVVGLLELFAARGQNRFYRELEEWLSTITRLGFAGSDVEGAGEAGPMLMVLDQMAEQMERLREVVAQSEAARGLVDDRLVEVAAAVTAMTRVLQHGDRSVPLLERIAAGQERLAEAQARMAEGQEGLTAVQGRIAEGQDRLAGVQGGIAEGQARLAEIQSRIAEGQERMAAAQGRLAEGQERMAEGQERLAGIELRIADGQSRLAEGQERLAEGQERIADGQEGIALRLARVAEARAAAALPDGVEDGHDPESRMRLRSIDLQLLRVLEELAAGRQETVAEIREEIAGVAREIRRVRAPAVPHGPTGTIVGSRD